MANEIRVMVVDDSAVVRQVLGGLIDSTPGMRVIATAQDPIAAQQKMGAEWPDVLVLDIEMPRMDGITFLRQIMRQRPTPVIICSSHTEQGARASVEAMSAGAVGIVTKPRLGLRDFLSDASEELLQAIREAAAARLRPAQPQRTGFASNLAGTKTRPSLPPSSAGSTRIIAIGTSTGGTQALERVLVDLPTSVPGIVIVQHMPERFTAAFAERLDMLCQIRVKEASHGDAVLPGQALIAPGGRHMKLSGSPGQYRVDVQDGPPINRHKPSVDVLFRSVALVAGKHATGVIMTGMGDDGARGLLEMRQNGARTFAQDEASSVVFGMPKEAIQMGAAELVLPLDRIGPELLRVMA